ncbi:MAG TPA: glycosyl hydrolase 115 family protein [Candidatus Acidoferrales bacterium]|jgi:hypothetical protein|nr:glycosyl hydrolase 115 family protein [Candidatus Acidoferrales bacterium]
MNLDRIAYFILVCGLVLTGRAFGLEVQFTPQISTGALALADGKTVLPVLVETNNDRAVLRAVGDLSEDFSRVTGRKPMVKNDASGGAGNCLLIGTLGRSKIIDQLVASKKLDVTSVSGQWESYVLQVVENPLPGIRRALVIAGSDRRGTIFGIYELSERIGVSPWNWWADVPVKKQNYISISGNRFAQGPPAVKYRGIFLNDEDWGLRPWASKTFDPATGNIGPKTYAKIFELLLRLRANYIWPAMHPGTRAFNFYPEDKDLADEYAIVMGSSHCEQMLRNNVDEWDEKKFGEYNYVSNRDGVLKYWEQRVRENGKYDSIYTVGMRGIHDGAMPGGGTEREKAARLHSIIADQRAMLAQDMNTNVAQVPQIFCPYKEVLGLYRLAPEIPEDITLVWPDDNYGYVRQFSNTHERERSGGAGVYYHVSYWGGPRDYLWLCSTPPALIAEEMTKAYDYGASNVWILNVGDLKPAELDIEFFLKLGWNPHVWNGTNTYDLLQKQIARDFGPSLAPELTAIMAGYYRLNFQRKPEHIGFPTNGLFSAGEAAQRLAEWEKLSGQVEAVEKKLPPELHDAFFELIAYPVNESELINEKILDPMMTVTAEEEIHRLTALYNGQIAGGKWRNMMSDNPRGQMEFKSVQKTAPAAEPDPSPNLEAAKLPGADFAEVGSRCVMQAEHASSFIPGKDANWQKITGLGYNGEAVSIFPATVPVRATPDKILAGSPCLQFKVWLSETNECKVTVRSLPTFSVETGKPQRYAIAFDDAPPQIISLPASMSERDRQWQENVLRNAALTTSEHTLGTAGLHTLKLWMVDPGIVIDTIAVEGQGAAPLGYVWPKENRIKRD